MARISGVTTNAITIVGVTTVPGVANGKLPLAANLNVTDLKILSTQLEESSDSTLFTRLPKGNVASVDLTDASLSIRKTFTVTIANNQITTATRPEAEDGEVFLPFTAKRYSLIRADGTVEQLSSDKFNFNNDSTIIDTIRGLGSDTEATLIATLRKSNQNQRQKLKILSMLLQLTSPNTKDLEQILVQVIPH